MIVSTYLGSSSIRRAWRPVFSQAMSVEPRAAERFEDGVPALARIADRPLDQGDGLIVECRSFLAGFVKEPDVTLIAGAAPVVVVAVSPPVQDQFG